MFKYIFKEVDTRGGNHDEMKPGETLVYFQVYFSLHFYTVKTNLSFHHV